MAWVNANDGSEIYYEKHGTGNVIVFVSGYMGIIDIWDYQIEKLSSQYCCITHDNRGYGRSAKIQLLNSYSIKQHADDLNAVLNDAKVNTKVILVTHSMGGNIATQFYLDHPDRVAGIVYTAVNFDGKQAKSIGFSVEGLMSQLTSPADRIQFYHKMGLRKDIACKAAEWPLYALKGMLSVC